MDIIYLGLMFCEDSLKDEFKAIKRKISMAPHKFQANLIRGIAAQEDVNLSVINIPPTGSFPINNKHLWSKAYKWGAGNQQISYLNLPWIKHRIQEKRVYRLIKSRIVNPESTCLMVYSLYEPYLKTAWRIKKAYPSIRLCLLHTDAVPGRDDMEKYMSRAAQKRGDRAVALAKDFDSFILLTKNLVEPLEVGSRPHLIVECLCDEKQQPAATDVSQPGAFLYTGEVCKVFGICELAEAFREMPDLQLWICGDGDARDQIEEISATCSNIRYFGYVTPERIKKLQNECAFLVNPRRPSGTYTKYSFPSKTAEYMMTGKPVVMYKLEAIPDAYDAYINYLTESSPQGICKEIRAITNADYGELMEKARKGRTYMLDNKSADKIGRSIVCFLA